MPTVLLSTVAINVQTTNVSEFEFRSGNKKQNTTEVKQTS